MSRPWMPFYVADYLADTGHLSTVEHGAYMLLIMHYWQNGVLPVVDQKLARICRMSESVWNDVRDTLAGLFDSDWRHKRIDEELAKTEDMLAKRSAAGKAGASARYGNRMTKAQQTDSHSQSPVPSQEVITENSAREVSKAEEEALLSAAGASLDRTSTLLFSMPIPMSWKDAGMDWELDVLPGVRNAALHAPEGGVRSWKYFSQAIADWHAKRTVPMPAGNERANANGRAPKRTTADFARELSRQFRERERGNNDPVKAIVLLPGAG